MVAYKRSHIDQLEEAVWFYCVRHRSAKDNATMHRWQQDEFYYLNELGRIVPSN